jgi:hypothetical protein
MRTGKKGSIRTVLVPGRSWIFHYNHSIFLPHFGAKIWLVFDTLSLEIVYIFVTVLLQPCQATVPTPSLLERHWVP